MITQLDRNRLAGEMSALQDETAEELRLANISTARIGAVMAYIQEQHDECLAVLKDFPDADVQEVILAFRTLVRNLIKS